MSINSKDKKYLTYFARVKTHDIITKLANEIGKEIGCFVSKGDVLELIVQDVDKKKILTKAKNLY